MCTHCCTYCLEVHHSCHGNKVSMHEVHASLSSGELSAEYTQAHHHLRQRDGVYRLYATLHIRFLLSHPPGERSPPHPLTKERAGQLAAGIQAVLPFRSSATPKRQQGNVVGARTARIVELIATVVRQFHLTDSAIYEWCVLLTGPAVGDNRNSQSLRCWKEQNIYVNSQKMLLISCKLCPSARTL